jgi:hypothetical protein
VKDRELKVTHEDGWVIVTEYRNGVAVAEVRMTAADAKALGEVMLTTAVEWSGLTASDN